MEGFYRASHTYIYIYIYIYICIYIYLFIYLKLACHDEQNGSQSFNIQARITELWRFKLEKRKNLDAAKNGIYHFQQELMVSKTIVEVSS